MWSLISWYSRLLCVVQYWTGLELCIIPLSKIPRQYRVGQKSKPVYCCSNFVYFQPTFTIFWHIIHYSYFFCTVVTNIFSIHGWVRCLLEHNRHWQCWSCGFFCYRCWGSCSAASQLWNVTSGNSNIAVHNGFFGDGIQPINVGRCLLACIPMRGCDCFRVSGGWSSTWRRWLVVAGSYWSDRYIEPWSCRRSQRAEWSSCAASLTQLGCTWFPRLAYVLIVRWI